jgi:hypothetical protein
MLTNIKMLKTFLRKYVKINNILVYNKVHPICMLHHTVESFIFSVLLYTRPAQHAPSPTKIFNDPGVFGLTAPGPLKNYVSILMKCNKDRQEPG